MEIYVDGEFIKATDLEGVISFIDNYQPKEKDSITVKIDNEELLFQTFSKAVFLERRTQFLLEIIKVKIKIETEKNKFFKIELSQLL